MRLKQTVEPESQYIVDLIKMGSPIGKMIRRDMEPNIKSPIRPYGDASFLSMRDDFFGEGAARTRQYQERSYEQWQPQVREEAYHGESNPTILTSQPEIFNREHDEELDESDNRN